MLRTVKYTNEVTTGVCEEKLPGCDVKSGIIHACFVDGGGATICRNCFDRQINEGKWITDGSITIKAA